MDSVSQIHKKVGSELIFHSRQFNDVAEHRDNFFEKYLYIENELAAFLKYVILGTRAVSLPECPYAGLVLFKKVGSEKFKHRLQSEMEGLVKQGVSSLELKQPPIGPFPLMSEKVDLLLQYSGFRIIRKELNHHIDLGAEKVNLHKMEKRRIAKCMDQGYTFREEGIESMEEVHQFIAECRKQQGLVINIDQGKFARTFEELRPFYRLFTIRNNRYELIAATVTVQVNEEVVYNYLPAFDRGYSQSSPLALLHSQLVNLLKGEGYSFFDLGISSENGKIQKGLSDFKEHMGAVRSFRYTYQINF